MRRATWSNWPTASRYMGDSHSSMVRSEAAVSSLLSPAPTVAIGAAAVAHGAGGLEVVAPPARLPRYLAAPRLPGASGPLVLPEAAEWQGADAEVCGVGVNLARPGAGKTRYLARRVAHLIGT